MRTSYAFHFPADRDALLIKLVVSGSSLRFAAGRTIPYPAFIWFKLVRPYASSGLKLDPPWTSSNHACMHSLASSRSMPQIYVTTKDHPLSLEVIDAFRLLASWWSLFGLCLVLSSRRYVPEFCIVPYVMLFKVVCTSIVPCGSWCRVWFVVSCSRLVGSLSFVFVSFVFAKGCRCSSSDVVEAFQSVHLSPRWDSLAKYLLVDTSLCWSVNLITW